MYALGVDVSANRGLDLVWLEDNRTVAKTAKRVKPGDLPSCLADLPPDVVAIDSPPAWGTSGGSRLTERELRRFGINSFGTPSDPKQAENAFYDWMREGIAAFSAIADQFPRYHNGPARGTAMEVFPHATAVVLAGCLPPRGASKRTWREQILHTAGVATDELSSIDQVDAALAALTGLMALEGRSTALGDPKEGVIVIPTRILPVKPYPRSAEPEVDDIQPHLPGLSPCSCGIPECRELTRSEFAPGHDSKRKSWLWQQARVGYEAMDELEKRGWELPPEGRAR